MQWRRGPTPVVLGSSSLLSSSAGQWTRVQQVRGAEQPPVHAAGAGLHPGAGVPADLAPRPRPQLPRPRQDCRLLPNVRAELGRGVELYHAE